MPITAFWKKLMFHPEAPCRPPVDVLPSNECEAEADDWQACDQGLRLPLIFSLKLASGKLTC
jgi:hypothetical protein